MQKVSRYDATYSHIYLLILMMKLILLVTDFLFNAIYLSFPRLNQGNKTRNELDLILDSRFKNVDGRISHLEDMMAGLLDKVECKKN